MRDKDPFEQLERCHRRLEDACDALLVACEQHDLATVNDVREFLGRQIVRHEADEEESFFPRLRLRSSPNPDETATLLDRLATEHRAHEALAARLDGAIAKTDWAELTRVADEMIRAYRDHIEIEEKSLFPLARAAINDSDLKAIADEMSARRGR
jgi:hemerythrin-like domain-containing protein